MQGTFFFGPALRLYSFSGIHRPLKTEARTSEKLHSLHLFPWKNPAPVLSFAATAETLTPYSIQETLESSPLNTSSTRSFRSAMAFLVGPKDECGSTLMLETSSYPEGEERDCQLCAKIQREKGVM
ncbi:hypothetical protein JZ751_004393 [Albula glossodonta]|uniref:Uncharacterized protein n=1 Tax=Albula glossodonta TaxID=121402 RepID=A0A8T2NCZ2_9TELE|nr:hypothetical protein JZ751_004393 [Albula glossodonta]